MKDSRKGCRICKTTENVISEVCTCGSRVDDKLCYDCFMGKFSSNWVLQEVSAGPNKTKKLDTKKQEVDKFYVHKKCKRVLTLYSWFDVLSFFICLCVCFCLVRKCYEVEEWVWMYEGDGFYNNFFVNLVIMGCIIYLTDRSDFFSTWIKTVINSVVIALLAANLEFLSIFFRLYFPQLIVMAAMWMLDFVLDPRSFSMCNRLRYPIQTTCLFMALWTYVFQSQLFLSIWYIISFSPLIGSNMKCYELMNPVHLINAFSHYQVEAKVNGYKEFISILNVLIDIY